LVVEEAALVEVGGRSVQETDWDAIPAGAKSQLKRTFRSYSSDPAMVLAMSKALASGLQGLGGGRETRSKLKGATAKVYPYTKTARGQHWDPSPVSVSVDPMYWGPYVRDNLRNIDALLQYVEPSDHNTVRHHYRRWPRWLFVDWITNRLSYPVAKRWGLAGDGFALVREAMREWGLVPKSCTKSTDVRSWWLTLEQISAYVEVGDLLSFGA
jgi:hypothetical protein